MGLGNAMLVGLKEIWAHKARSILTMFGIILGVSSLVAMSALVRGMENGMKEALVATGGLEKIRLEPQSELPVWQRHLAEQAVGVTLADVKALQANAPLLKQIVPAYEIMRWGGAAAVFSYQGRNTRSTILAGTWPGYAEVNEHVIEHGRMITDLDNELVRSVCVIGTGLRDELFGSPEETGREIIPIGERITINGQSFTVVGLLQHYESEQARREREYRKTAGQTNTVATGPSRSRGWGGRGGGGGWIFRMKNYTAMIPLQTMFLKFRAATVNPNAAANASEPTVADYRLSAVHFRVPSMEDLEPALQQARNVLMFSHRGIEDFTFRTQEDWAAEINTFIRATRTNGTIIAAISLIVGGIGIMNIMLASISERVREIGIRKAVGATTGLIFLQILVESVVISMMGGVAGLGFSFGVVQLIGAFTPTDNAPEVTVMSLSVAFGFSVLVGILAGLYPAIRASRFHPIQALRYE
ncbi:MAG: ABC transporter permease [Verrucomicrobiales bacterium]|nr:ABC transporter permease [Verrucomicrobiales bacterium]